MKQKSIFRMFLAMVLMAFCGNGAWAAPKTYTHEFVKGDLKEGSVTLSQVSWDCAPTWGVKGKSYWGFNNEKGIQVGSSANYATKLVLSTSNIPGNITNVVANVCGASKIKGTLQVTVGGQQFGTPIDLTSTATDYTFVGQGTGMISIIMENNSPVDSKGKSKAMYIKSISITYDDGKANLEDQTISFGNQKSFTVFVNETFTAPELSGAKTAVTYESSKPTVAEVVKDGNNAGAITIKGVGTTIITATAAEDATYNKATDSYTLTVNALPVDVENIADFIAKGKVDNEATYRFKTPVVVVAQSGENLWVQDNSASIQVYGSVGQTYAYGDEIPAGFTGMYQDYFSTLELVDPAGFAPKSQSGVAVNAEEMTIEAIAVPANINKLVLVKNVVGVETGISDGVNTIVTQNRFGVQVPGDGILYDVKAIVYKAKDGYKLLPVSMAKVQNDKQNQNLSFAQPTYKAVMGQAFIAPQVEGAQTTVSYSSSDEGVATVNAETGAVTLVKEGVATITATAAANEQYNMGLASYELVVEGAGATLPFKQEFSSTKPIDERFVTEGVGSYSSANTCLKFGVTDNSLILKLADAPGSLSYCIKWNGNGTFGTFVVETSEDGLTYTELKKYVNGDLKSNTDVNVRFSLNEKVRYIRWTYTEKVNGNVALGAIFVSKQGEASTLPLEITAAKYATVYLNEAFVMPEGLVGNTVNVVGDKVKLNAEYVAGDVVPAQTPLLLAGEEGAYQAGMTLYEAKAPKANDLKGAADDAEIVAPANAKLYIFANDPENGLGFYYQGKDSDGSKVANLAGKAYLEVVSTPAQPAAVQGYRLDGNEVTGIEAVEAANENAAIYTISGVRVSAEKGNLPKGLYIVNGKKVLVK